MDTVTMAHLHGGQTTVAIAELTAFAEQLRGSLIQPGDTDYDQARRLWNGMFDIPLLSKSLENKKGPCFCLFSYFPFME